MTPLAVLREEDTSIKRKCTCLLSQCVLIYTLTIISDRFRVYCSHDSNALYCNDVIDLICH